MRLSAKISAALCAVSVLSVLSVASAQTAPPTPEEQAAEMTATRQGLFKLMGFNMDPMAAMLRNRIPFDAAQVQKSAARIEALAPMIPEVFKLDTRKFQVKTKAREGIWNSQADFNAKADELAKAAAALSAAAKGGDKGATMKAIGAVGKACGNCHDNFRDK
jgi:cytochrome c556